jgi:mannose-6-phosphate isomerase-like protein (cupin superfamily)
MTNIDQNKLVVHLIKSLCFKLNILETKFPTLTNFISEFENLNLSSIGETKQKRNPPEIALALLELCIMGSNVNSSKNFNSEYYAHLNWSQIYDEIDLEMPFTKGMFASRLVGLDGYYFHRRLSFGLMMLLPDVVYPPHTHLVDELYYSLSGKLTVKHGIPGDQVFLNPGEISITPKGKLHSLSVSGNKPVLLLYSWLGNLRAPIWIWKKIEESHWERSMWTRLPGKKWSLSKTQLVSQKLLTSASKL